MQDFLSAFLEEYPNVLYEAMRPSAPSAGYNFMDYWRRQQNAIWQEYQGFLGKGMIAGQAPNMSYQSFLGNYPWLQRYLGLAPEERGERASLFSPRLRWNI